MAYQIITTTELRITDKFKFKNQQLNEFSERIAKLYQNAASYAETKNREMACLLAEVMETKCYLDDGFDSVASYAASTFGILKSNAYQLARAGQIYRNPEAPESLKSMTPSKLAELSAVPDEIVYEAAAKGEIKADTTQKKLREFATAHKQEAVQSAEQPEQSEVKPEILKQYRPKMIPSATVPEMAAYEGQHKTIPEWEEIYIQWVGMNSYGSAVEVVNLPKGYASEDAKTKTVVRKLFLSSTMSVVVEFREYKETARKTSAIPGLKFTKAQLLELLARVEQFESQNGVEAGDDTPMNTDQLNV